MIAALSYGQKTAPKETEAKALARLEVAYKSAKAKAKAKPKVATLRKAHARAATALGTAVMNSQAARSRSQKYVEALKLFREALAIDPSDAEAKQNKELIESIYLSMGKKIPQ